ncbi:MAG: hypothetical protein QM817_33020 [Archangium sp.]
MSLSEADLATLFQEGRAKRRGMALFRVGIVWAVCAVFIGIGIAVGGAFLCISVFTTGAVAVAFLLDAVRNLGGSMLFVIGRVTHSGWVTDGDGDGGLAKVPRVTVDVEECFVRTTAGTRTDLPGAPRLFVIEMPQWLERLKADQRVVLVCLPSSTDPVHWRVLS